MFKSSKSLNNFIRNLTKVIQMCVGRFVVLTLFNPRFTIRITRIIAFKLVQKLKIGSFNEPERILGLRSGLNKIKNSFKS